jgi:hypothetical protein
MNVKIKTNASGEISGFRYHDGALTGISFVANATIDVGITDASGDRATITLSDVDFFMANNIREGNTIDRMFLWPIADAPNHVKTSIVDLFGLVSFEACKGDSSEKFVFHLSSSFGAEIYSVVGAIAASKAFN